MRNRLMKNGSIRRTTLSSSLLLGATLSSTAALAQAPIDLDTGNAATQVVVPLAIPAMLQSISPGDAPLILRMTAMITTGWFDAIAPYHPTAVGVYSSLGRQPASERLTHQQRNIAVLYASHQVLNSILPNNAAQWDAMLTDFGLPTAVSCSVPDSATCIGFLAGQGVVAAREHDGMNQLGDEGGRVYNRMPYADYTGYAPVNTPEVLSRPGRWQPDIVTSGNGVFSAQQFVVPQLGQTQPFSFELGQFQVPPPRRSRPGNTRRYKAQADEVLALSAALTDEQKVMSELFDHKFNSLATVGFFVTQSAGLDFDQTIQYEFLLNFSSFDGAIATWGEKRRFDTVRPYSAIRYLYEGQNVTAWGGPGQGTVTDMPGEQWRPYLQSANHPEYPSASSCFCAAHGEASRLFLGTDQLGWSFVAPAGSSTVEPGITPAQEVTLEFPTWTDFESKCQESRILAGVHFRASTVAGSAMCKEVAQNAHQFFENNLQGLAQ